MKAIILLNGKSPSKELCLNVVNNSSLIIACDGALDYALEYGITPNIAIGDMDSTKREDRNKLIKEIVVFPVEKDEIDSQLAMDLAIEKGYKDIVLLGATGGRIDHEFANLQLMYRYAKQGINIESIDEYNHIKVQTGHIKINGEVGQKVSLLPIESEVRVESSDGLYYSLNNRIMTFDEPIGVSNVLMKPEASVVVKSGYLLIIKVLNELK